MRATGWCSMRQAITVSSLRRGLTVCTHARQAGMACAAVVRSPRCNRATQECVARRERLARRAKLIAVGKCQADGSGTVSELPLQATVAVARIDGPLIVGHGMSVEQIVAER